MPSAAATIRTLLPWALAGLLCSAAAPALAQRAITSSSGGGGIGTLVLRNVLDVLDPCMVQGGAQSDACRASTGSLAQSASIAFAQDFGSSRGESWTQVTPPINLFRWSLADPAAASLRVQFDYSLRHNFVLGVGGRWTDAGGTVRDWSGYHVYRDVQVENPIEPVNDPALGPESFGNAMPSGFGQLWLDFFHLDPDPFLGDDGGLYNHFDQARGLSIDSVSIDFFHVEPAAQGGERVPEPGTLALVGLALAGLALRRRR